MYNYWRDCAEKKIEGRHRAVACPYGRRGSHLADHLRHRDRCRSAGRWNFYFPIYLCLDKRRTTMKLKQLLFPLNIFLFSTLWLVLGP